MIAPDDVAAIAAAVAHELERRRLTLFSGSLTVEDVAARLNVRPDYVYRHARQLGGLKLPGGQSGQGRWRFPPERLMAALDAGEDEPQAGQARSTQTRAVRATRVATAGDLLPIRGVAGVPSPAIHTKRPGATIDRPGPDQEVQAP